MATTSSKGRIATIVAVGGLIVSILVYLQQLHKNQSELGAAAKQNQILQGQVDNAAKQAQDAKKAHDADCEKRRSEHDDALNALHLYDEHITKLQGELTLEKNASDMARQQGIQAKVDEHNSLAETLESDIQLQQQSRQNAASRVQQLEQGCSF